MLRTSRIGTIGSLTLISLLSGIGINRAIAQVGADQPVRNPGISGISSPALPSSNSGVTTNQPVTNPGVSGGNFPNPGLSQPNPTVNGSQPINNPGISGISTPSLDSNGSQPVNNPGTSGISTPSSNGSGSQPVTNPGTSGINSPSLTQPNQPDTTRTIVAPNGVPDVIIRQPNSGTATPNTQRRVTQPGGAQTPQPSQPTPSQTDNGTPTGFIRTAISSQLASNPNIQRLDAQLLQATCSQNWQGAIAIVDRALESAPANQTYRSQLRTYRTRLETLSNARTVIPNWSQKCTGG